MQKLKENQVELFRSKKMPMIGQLVANTAYETMTPTGDINRDLAILRKYMARVNKYVDACDRHLGQHNHSIEKSFENGSTMRKNLKIEYVLQEVIDLIDESMVGADRIKATVENLKSLSRINKEQPDLANINNCLDATLNIIWCEIKEQRPVVKNYGDLPLISCYPQQIGHVFSHLLLNAVQALDGNSALYLTTRVDNGFVVVEISDDGLTPFTGHPPLMFEPAGMAGLGFNVFREIVQKHGGDMVLKSRDGQGSVCQVSLPVDRQH